MLRDPSSLQRSKSQVSFLTVCKNLDVSPKKKKFIAGGRSLEISLKISILGAVGHLFNWVLHYEISKFHSFLHAFLQVIHIPSTPYTRTVMPQK